MAPMFRIEPGILLGFLLEGKHFCVLSLPREGGGSNKKDPLLWVFDFDEWRPHGDSNPGRHRERVMS